MQRLHKGRENAAVFYYNRLLLYKTRLFRAAEEFRLSVLGAEKAHAYSIAKPLIAYSGNMQPYR